MSLNKVEKDLKALMGYTEDVSRRCGNCVNYSAFDCWLNKAIPLKVDATKGRCEHFSAKKPRQPKIVVAAITDQSESLERNSNA